MSMNDTALVSASPAPTALSEDGPGSCARCESEAGQFSQWRLRFLERAAESAITVLEKITADVVASEVTVEGDLGPAYAGISKALRQALALHARFEADSYKTQQERAAQAAARQAREAQRAAALVTSAKYHQIRQVKQSVMIAMDVELAEDKEKFDYGTMYCELKERLDDFDDYSDCGRKPISEIVEGICKVLGLKFDPIWWEDEPWAIAEAKAKLAGSPAAAPPTADRRPPTGRTRPMTTKTRTKPTRSASPWAQGRPER
jgi:hypothetical protein